jgi:hypothetical protein
LAFGPRSHLRFPVRRRSFRLFLDRDVEQARAQHLERLRLVLELRTARPAALDHDARGQVP